MTAPAEGTCPNAVDQMTITVRPNPTAGIAVTGQNPVCYGGSSVLTVTATPNSIVTYRIGTGTNQTIAVGPTGTATLPTGNLTTTTTYNLVSVAYNDIYACLQPSTGSVTVTVNPLSTANAGADQTICQGASVTMAGSVGGGATTGTWSGGTGTFTNPAILNTTYTPGVGETGIVNLTLTTNGPSGPCSPVTDQVAITINTAATVVVGADQTVCEGTPVTLSATLGGSATSGTWSGGTGSFTPGPTTLNAIYTPGSGEYGDVTLTFTTNDPADVCTAVTDQVVITYDRAATVDAGTDQAICAGGAVTLAGIIGGAVNSGTWSGGAGSFNPDSNTLNAVYTPSPAEITARGVTLTLTTTDPAGLCGPVSESMRINISQPVLITTQPFNEGVCVSYPASLSVVATGDSLTYQWFRVTLPADTPVPGGTSSILSFPQAGISDAGPYYVIVSGGHGCNTVTSNTVTLNVDEVITVDQQPLLQTVCAGESATFTISARPAGEISFQWRKDGVVIVGATSPTFTISVTQPGDGGIYDVIISGMSGYYCSSAVSAPAALTVNQQIITLLSGDGQTVCVGDPLTNPIRYQLGGVATNATVTGLPSGLSGTTVNGVFTISGTPTATGTFNFLITTSGQCAPATANGTITITENSTLVLTSGSEVQTLCTGDPIENITYAIGGGGTNATVMTSIGNNGSFKQRCFTISGSTSLVGSFSYLVTTLGLCDNVSLGGTITVGANSTISHLSGPEDQTICFDSAISSISYQVGGGATGATTLGLPDGVTGVYNPPTGVFTISGTPLSSGQFNYTVTTTGPCDNISMYGVINVNSSSEGGTVMPAGQLVCHDQIPAPITWTGFGSDILIGWEYSTNTGMGWTSLGITSTTLTFSAPLTQTTLYRAIIQSGVCPVTYSPVAAVNVIPLTNVTGTASPATICECNSSTLTANANLPGNDIPGGFSGGGFDNSSLPGWLVNGSSQIPSAADNQTEGVWGRTT
jgi:hypothetical protein